MPATRALQDVSSGRKATCSSLLLLVVLQSYWRVFSEVLETPRATEPATTLQSRTKSPGEQLKSARLANQPAGCLDRILGQIPSARELCSALIDIAECLPVQTRNCTLGVGAVLHSCGLLRFQFTRSTSSRTIRSSITFSTTSARLLERCSSGQRGATSVLR